MLISEKIKVRKRCQFFFLENFSKLYIWTFINISEKIKIIQ